MNRFIYILSVILLFLCPGLQAETMVYLVHSETLSFDEELYPEAQLLKGDVIFRHDSALMYCDSALFYEKNNSLDAFGNVRLVQGDTLEGFSDVLFYDGNTKFARMRKNVKLIHTGTTLTTDSLNYDRLNDLAWYFSGGKIVDSLNTLTSVWGQYTPSTRQTVFKTDVLLVNDRFVLTADTLKYNTASNIADLVGPTKIIYEEETTILSTLGWYNTRTEESMLLNRSEVIHEDGRSLTGDTIFYDKHFGKGDVVGHMCLIDSVQQGTLYGNLGKFFETDKYGFATDSALYVDWSEEDRTYVHADTLYSEEIPYQLTLLQPLDSIMVDSVLTWQPPDTLLQDTSYRQIRAFYHVRIYRSDMQAICDSLVTNNRDSVMIMNGKPVIWSDNQQISAELVNVYLKNGTVDYVHGIGSAIASQQDAETWFNQLSGKELLAYIREGEMRQIDVNGNAETVFYPHEDDGKGPVVGVNKTQSSYVKMYLQNQKVDHIVFTSATTGAMYPLDKISESQTRLGSFFWAEDERPKNKDDVFRHPQSTQRPEQVALSAKDTTAEENTDSEKEDSSDSKRNSRGRKRAGR